MAAVEYGLLLALIAMVVSTSAVAVGASATDLYRRTCIALSAGASCGSGSGADTGEDEAEDLAPAPEDPAPGGDPAPSVTEGGSTAGPVRSRGTGNGGTTSNGGGSGGTSNGTGTGNRTS